MSIQFDIAKQIIAKTCPNRKLKLENQLVPQTSLSKSN